MYSGEYDAYDVTSKGRRFDSHRGQAYFSSLPGVHGYTLRVTSQASPLFMISFKLSKLPRNAE
jgi:hypothetical protein